MQSDVIQSLILGFTSIMLITTTVAMDRSLFTMKGDYWTRFAYIGLRYGLGAFILWCLYVFLPFHLFAER